MSSASSQITQRARDLRLQPLVLAWLAAFAALLVLIVAVAILGHSRDGEPVASLALTDFASRISPEHAAGIRSAAPARSLTTAQTTAASPGARAAPALPATASPVPAATAMLPRHISAPLYTGGVLIADPALIEETQQGPIPRIAQDGRMPMTAYAPAVAPSSAKKIAIVVTGLGLSAKVTTAALDALPPGITMAFAPYADDVQTWATEARRRGHEVLLEIPMEPYDFPDSDPGPHTLRAAAGEDSNVSRLTWSLSRFAGYAGVTNLLGERFLADSEALAPIMTYLTRRGLLFVDTSSSEHSVAPDVARQVGAAYLHSAVTIDAIESAMEIEARLSDIETRARSDGTAIGTGFAYPVTVSQLANWAQGLPERGFVLVPASAIVATAK
ncbi:MAG TPA: divergent polysaccharide deacetylase family protein [Rhizomicrobium sp.]|jgi:hypothetical protein